MRDGIFDLIQASPGLIAYWPMQELSGVYAYDRSSGSASYPGSEAIVNGEFTADTNWTKGDAAITIASGKATWSGAQAGNADLTAAVAPLVNATRYVIHFTVSGYSAGTITPIFGTQAGTARSANGAYSEEVIANGTAFLLRGNLDFAGSVEVVSVKPANPLNGAITGATVGQAADGKLGYSYLFDGSTDYVNIYSAALNAAIASTGTIVIFSKVTNAGVLTDGASRNLFVVGAGGTDFLGVVKHVTNNTLRVTVKTQNNFQGPTFAFSSTSVTMFVLTYEYTNPNTEYQFFINATLQAAITPTVGEFLNGAVLSSTGCVIGALSTSPTNLYSGFESHCGLWNRVLSQSEITAIYAKAGI